MEFSIKFSQDGPLYGEGPQVVISKNIVFLSLIFEFVFSNNEEPDQMRLNAAFYPLNAAFVWVIIVCQNTHSTKVTIQLFNQVQCFISKNLLWFPPINPLYMGNA